MKVAPVIAALDRTGRCQTSLVHTGQHYDDAMSRIFLEQLGVGPPTHALEVGSGSHATQTARIMTRMEGVLENDRPDLLLVPGDINSTLAATLVAAKLGIPVGHIEAGLRSFDRSMPEELNRILTDQLSSALFIHSPEARDNLIREGIDERRIHSVGNTMIDTLVAMRPAIDNMDAPSRLGLDRRSYVVVTLHRPALVDGPLLRDAVAALEAIATDVPVAFPIHPRTRRSLDRQGLGFASKNVRLLDPLGYLEFLSLVDGSAGVITDSGGIQEETTFLSIPCFTLRDNTERPITCEMGTNVLLGLAPERIREVPKLLLEVAGARSRIPPGWDGHAADRVASVVLDGIPDWDDDAGLAPSPRGARRRCD